MFRRLTMGYFFRNRRKTFIAIAILALTSSIIISSSLLINGYQIEIRNVSELGLSSRTSTDYFIAPAQEDQNFTSTQLFRLSEIMEQNNVVEHYYFSYELFQKVNYQGEDIIFRLIISNFNHLNDTGRIVLSHFNSSTILSNLDQDQVGSLLATKFANVDINSSLQNVVSVDSLSPTNFIAFPQDSVFFTKPNIEFNLLELDLKSSESEYQLLNELSGLDLKIYTSDGNIIFLQSSFQELLQILRLLNSILSILLIFSISYLMVALIDDSKKDLKLFKMIGMPDKYRFLVFLVQVAMISLVGFIIAIFLSYAMVTTFISMLSTVANFPYMTIEISSKELLQHLGNIIFIGVVSGTISLLKVLYFK